jgi:hypothetical protein
MRKPTAGDLLAVAAVALVAGILLALIAPGAVVGAFPLWDLALAAMALAILLSVIAYPAWWEWDGGWNAERPDCSRRQHARHHQIGLIGKRHRTRDLLRRAELGHGFPHHPGSGPLAVGRRRLRGPGLPASRRNSHARVLSRSYGRSRG